MPITSARRARRASIRSATGEKFGRVFETVARVRQDLPRETALIGFCGAPWTVATYMVGGRGLVRSGGGAAAGPIAIRQALPRLIDIVTEASIDYLDGQVRAGADVLQIFDSWAGNLPEREFDAWVVAPTARIVAELKRRHPGVPIIGFPRGAGANAERYVRETGVEGIGCDTAMPLARDARASRRGGVAVQGNLDPLLLVAGGAALDARVRETLEAMRGAPFIFNLGHGIVPQTPPENVARLVELVARQAAAEPMLWLKALHIIAVIAWFAGLFYLPRLFVYHADAEPGSELSETFKVMERRLLRVIMNPAMVVVWVTGPWLAWWEGVYSDGWLHAKLALVVAALRLPRRARPLAQGLRRRPQHPIRRSSTASPTRSRRCC